jgi:hypothetical protein
MMIIEREKLIFVVFVFFMLIFYFYLFIIIWLVNHGEGVRKLIRHRFLKIYMDRTSDFKLSLRNN